MVLGLSVKDSIALIGPCAVREIGRIGGRRSVRDKDLPRRWLAREEETREGALNFKDEVDKGKGPRLVPGRTTETTDRGVSGIEIRSQIVAKVSDEAGGEVILV